MLIDADGPHAGRGRAIICPQHGNLRRPAAVLLGIALGLPACTPGKEGATIPGSKPAVAAPATTGASGQPHPVALAPSLTGAPSPATAPAHAEAPAAAPITTRPLPPPAAPSAPPPAAATTAADHAAPPPPQPATAPSPAAAAAAPPRAAPPDKPCPPGTIGMWSPPDVIGQSVYICRSQGAPPP